MNSVTAADHAYGLDSRCVSLRIIASCNLQASLARVRINDQWRVIFKWIEGEPHDVRIVDYH